MDIPIQPSPRKRRIRRLILAWVVLCFISVLASCVRIAVTESGKPRAWRGGGGTDLRTSVGLAPDPAVEQEAVVQVYAARTWGAKKVFAVHTWIAAKPAGASSYTTYQVMGWRLRRGGSAVVVEQGTPDRPWYGNTPELLREHRGDRAQRLIDQLDTVVAAYPYAGEYRSWPGPNSNTFIAFIARRLPELGLDLPSTAIGKDYLGDRWTDVSTAGDGFQWSMSGLASVAMAPSVGLEMNLLGLNLELDLADAALELPGFGRIGVLEWGCSQPVARPQEC